MHIFQEKENIPDTTDFLPTLSSLLNSFSSEKKAFYSNSTHISKILGTFMYLIWFETQNNVRKT